MPSKKKGSTILACDNCPELRETMKSMKEMLTTLYKKVITGNGEESLLERLARLEDYVNAHRRIEDQTRSARTRAIWSVGAALVFSVLSLGGVVLVACGIAVFFFARSKGLL